MSQTKSQDFGGFLPVKSERKVQMTKIWSYLIDLTELFHIKPFPKVVDRFGRSHSPKSAIFWDFPIKLLLMIICAKLQIIITTNFVIIG